jgi:hypothetical protein
MTSDRAASNYGIFATFRLPFSLIMQALRLPFFSVFRLFGYLLWFAECEAATLCKKIKKSKIRKKVNDIVFLIPETYNIRTELKQKEGVPDE